MSANSRTKGHAATIRQAYQAARWVIGDNLAPEHLTFQLVEGGSHIYWLAGHLTTIFDFTMNTAQKQPRLLPKEYLSCFGMNTTALEDASKYPPFEEILQEMVRVHDTLLDRMGGLDDNHLTEPFEEGSVMASMFGTPETLYRLTPFHIGYHTGQISLLKRAQGLSSPLGRK